MNSDVPGGFAESSLLPDLARKITDIPELDYNSFGDRMVDAISYAIYNARTMKIDNQEFTIYYSLANFYKGEFISNTILNANSFEKLIKIYIKAI